VELEGLRRANADLAIGGDESVDLGNPRLTSPNRRDRDSISVAGDLTRIGEEVHNRLHIEGLEARAVRVEEVLVNRSTIVGSIGRHRAVDVSTVAAAVLRHPSAERGALLLRTIRGLVR
jgi:hypothetical protein